MATVLVTRPEPGASQTAARLRNAGHRVIISPMFSSIAVEWEAPDGPFDAVMLTSEAAARLAGPGAMPFAHLPTFCVGPVTLAAATAAGFANVIPGPEGAAALAQMIAAQGHRHILHLAARDRTPIPDGIAKLTVCTVYRTELCGLSTEATAALRAGEIDWALLFSARSATEFAAVCPDRERLSVAAISQAALSAAGSGWRKAVAATAASEFAVLAAAGLTCDKQS